MPVERANRRRIAVLLVAGAALLACSPSQNAGRDAADASEDPSEKEEPPDERYPNPENLPPLDLVVVGSAAKVRPEDRAAGADSAELTAARNEFESFQVVVHAEGEPVRGLRVSLGQSLKGPDGAVIPDSTVTIYREDYYTVVTPSDLDGAPGRWPDPLIPVVDTLVGQSRNAFPLDVPAGENRVAWIDLLVPRDAAPGLYRGALRVDADGFLSWVPIRLTVLALTLPSTSRLQTSFIMSDGTCAPLGLEGCDTDARVYARARQLFVRSALDHRVSLGYVHSQPVDAGQASALFEELFLPFVEGTGQTRLPGARLTTFLANRVTERTFTRIKDEAESAGFVDRAFVWSCDEPFYFPVNGDPPGNWRICRDVLEQDAATWPAARKLVTAHIQTAEENEATHLIDILVVNVEFLDGPENARFYEGNQRPLYDPFLADTTRHKEVWVYSACGSHGCTKNDDPYTRGWAGGYQIDAPASIVRAMPWLAFRYDLDGILYYDTVMQLATAWEDQYRYTGNGEGTLFYPGTPDRIGGTEAIPIESLRLKYLRDGLEDYELLARLADCGLGAEALRIALGLFPATHDANRTDAQIQTARRGLVELLLQSPCAVE